jgi:hypothetical protein
MLAGESPARVRISHPPDTEVHSADGNGRAEAAQREGTGRKEDEAIEPRKYQRFHG